MYFLTRAMAFFAGWSWITLCRDLSTLLAYHDAQTPARNYSGQFLVAFALGPMLTFLVLPDKAVRAEDGGSGGEEGSAGGRDRAVAGQLRADRGVRAPRTFASLADDGNSSQLLLKCEAFVCNEPAL